MSTHITDSNGDRLVDVTSAPMIVPGLQPSSPDLKLKWQGEIDASAIIRQAGVRAVITRLAQGEREYGRETLLGTALYHQGVCIQLGDNDATRESTALWYPLVEVNSEYGPVVSWAILVSPGSRWYVEIWG